MVISGYTLDQLRAALLLAASHQLPLDLLVERELGGGYSLAFNGFPLNSARGDLRIYKTADAVLSFCSQRLTPFLKGSDVRLVFPLYAQEALF